MSRRYQRQSPSGGVMSEPGRGITFDWGTSVPADGVVGYAPGCLFLDIDASAGSQLLVNEGTVTSAAFKGIASKASGTFTTLTATAGTVTTLTSTTATITTLNPTSIVRASQTWKVGGRAKVGGTSGWVVGAANDLGTIATMAASQSAGTLVVPVTGLLHVGDTITGFGVYSSINSAGGTVTLDAALRKLVVAAGATATDSSIASMTQVSVTSATASSATKTGLSETVVAGTQYYLLLTGTTAGSTTIELDGLEITVTTS